MSQQSSSESQPNLPPLPLPPSITQSYISLPSISQTTFLLTAGTNTPSTPLLLFCHGYPDLAYSWRHILPALAAKGYFCVAFDQRGYGRSTALQPTSTAYENTDLDSFGPAQNVADVLAIVAALGRERVDVIVGHDFGAVTATSCVLARPDVFNAVVVMSHPFDALPAHPGPEEIAAKQANSKTKEEAEDIHASLASLGRKHYKFSNSSPTAASEWDSPPQGLHSFLRGYFYLKSASDTRNAPFPLRGWTASELVKMPHYYIPKLGYTMAQTVEEDCQRQEEGLEKSRGWMPDDELDVYVREYSRTGFQGGLNWYRNRTASPALESTKSWNGLLAGRKIGVPAVFISGAQDWGNYQRPGALEGMEDACEDFRGIRIVKGAGHWVQIERPEDVVMEIARFVGEVLKGSS